MRAISYKSYDLVDVCHAWLMGLIKIKVKLVCVGSSINN